MVGHGEQGEEDNMRIERQHVVDLRHSIGALRRDIAIVRRKATALMDSEDAAGPAWCSAAGAHARAVIVRAPSNATSRRRRDAMQIDFAVLAAALDKLARDVDQRFSAEDAAP